MFLVRLEDNRRDKETLTKAIVDHVMPGSTIITDCWKGYADIELQGFSNHLTVNHSVNFVDPDTGAHMNTIESQWWQLKRKLPHTYHRTTFDSLLCEYMYRQMHRDCDLFKQLCSDISQLYSG